MNPSANDPHSADDGAQSFHPFLIPTTAVFGLLFVMFAWGVITGTAMDAVGYALGVVWTIAFAVSGWMLRARMTKKRG